MRDAIIGGGRSHYEVRNSIIGAGLILLFAATCSLAQLPTATILGTVKDTSGAVVPGSAVTARNVDTGQSRTATAAADGTYRVTALPVGSYEVRVEHPGFQTEVRSGLTLSVSQEAVVNITLAVGAVEQTLTVTGEAPLVNTTSGSLGSLVDEQKVADLPLNGRNYVDMTLLQPGVMEFKTVARSGGMQGTWFTSNGAPLRSNNYLLDGAPMVNFYGATSASVTGTTLGLEGIREYRVITNTFSAEYGMTMGSQMVAVSKSGANAFHGSVFEYLRNSALDARNFFDYQTVANTNRLPSFKRNNFGGSFGGPIRKDKTFFFGTYEGLRERLGFTTIDNVPGQGCHGAANAVITNQACPQLGSSTATATIAPVVAPLLALFPLPNLPGNLFTYPSTQATREDYGQIRADQTLSAKDSLFVRYTIDDADQFVPLAYPQFTKAQQSRAQFVTASETHIFSPSVLNTFRFSASRTTIGIDSHSGLVGSQYSFVPGLEIGGITISSGITTIGPESTTPQERDQNVFTWSDDVFYTHGRHSLKFGALLNHYQIPTLAGSFYRGTATFADLPSFLLAHPQTYTAVTPGSSLNRNFHYNTIGLYAQDDLRLRPNFTLNLGIRYEFMTVPVEKDNMWSALRDIQHDASMTVGAPFQNMSLKNFGPRLGFAWDVTGNGKTALRGGFAILYDIGNFNSFFGQGIPSNPPFASRSLVSNPPILTMPFTFPASAVGKAIRPTDYYLQQPHILEGNLTFERQLPFNMALTVAYAGSKGLNLAQNAEGNPTIPQVLPDGRQFWPANAPRTNPNWGTIDYYTAGASSWYNSLQVGLLKRLSKGLQLQGSYTWSKLLDDTQGQLNPETSNGSDSKRTDPVNRNVDWGRAGYDVEQNFRLNAIYHVPNLAFAKGAVGKLLNGWWTSGILSLQSGYPFTPALGTNRSRSGVNGGTSGIDRPNLVAGRTSSNIVLGGPNRYFDPTAFTIPTLGFLGNLGRNTLSGPGFATLDFSLAKDTAIPLLGERGKLEFRAEFFNILNRANFGLPARIVYTGRNDVEAPVANAGQITTTVGSSRQIQFALKILF